MPKFTIALLALIAVALAMAWPANAQEAAWRVTLIEGKVLLALPAQQPHQAHLNEIVGKGFIVTTGAKSAARLDNGRQSVAMSANSRVVIPTGKEAAAPNIIQELGSILFKVDHQNAPHFRVDTPLLAAIVKGTTFTVTVDAKETTVAVEEGKVDVRARRGPDHKDVETGHVIAIREVLPQQMIGPYPIRTWLAASGGRAALPSGGRGPTGDDPASPTSPTPLRMPRGTSEDRVAGGSTTVVVGGVGAGNAATADPGALAEQFSFRPIDPTSDGARKLSIEFGYIGYVAAAFVGGVIVYIFRRAARTMRVDRTKKRDRRPGIK